MKNPYSTRKDGRMYKEIIYGRDENGKYKKKMMYSRKNESWRDFDKRVREEMINADCGKYIEKDITLGECIDLWWKTQVHLSGSTITTYRSNLKRIEHLRFIKLKDLKPFHFQEVYVELYRENATNLIQKLPTLVNSILYFAVDNGYATTNVNKKIKVPSLKHNKRRCLTHEEKRALEKAFEDFTPFQKAFVGLLYYTGMRRGEILALKTTDINFKENYISVSRTVTIDKNYRSVEKQGTKTSAGVRKIPIVSKLKSILQEYIPARRHNSDYLFLTKGDNFYDSGTVRYHWKNILDIINFYMPDGKTTNISPHYFRHNFATELAYANVPMKTAQYLLGHEHIHFTMDVYADTRLDMEASIDLLEKVLI